MFDLAGSSARMRSPNNAGITGSSAFAQADPRSSIMHRHQRDGAIFTRAKPPVIDSRRAGVIVNIPPPDHGQPGQYVWYVASRRSRQPHHRLAKGRNA
jgi:hypothetical protein